MPATAKTLIAAVKKGDRAAALRLIRKGADPNERDADGLTALMWAARKGHRQLMAILLEFGSHPNARDRQGRTALHHAVAARHRAVIRTLVAAHPDLNAKDADSCTPLELATLADDYEIAKALFDLGAKGSPPDPGVISMSHEQGRADYLPIHETIDLLSLRLSELPVHNPWGTQGHLHVFFQTPGPRSPHPCPLPPGGEGRVRGRSAHDGIRQGTFSKKNRVLVVRVAVPRTLLKKRPIEFLLSSVHKAVDLAERVFRRAKIEFAAAAIREQLQAIEVMRNWEFPDFRS